jgi:uncharacterized membrane protein
MWLDQGPVRSFGQIVPKRFIELIRDKNPAKVKAVMDAMMNKVKLDVAGSRRERNASVGGGGGGGGGGD